VQGVQRTQEELGIVMPKIPKGVKTNDNMVGGVDSLKYSDHDVSDAIKFPYLAAQSYLERRGEGPSGTTVGACTVDPGTVQHRHHELIRHTALRAWETHKQMCQTTVSEGA
jgi:hypothetical protein